MHTGKRLCLPAISVQERRGPSGLYEKPVQLSGELQAQRKTVSKIEVESNQRDN